MPKPAKSHATLLDMARTRCLGPDPQGHQAVFIDGVPQGTGADGGRTADAISMGLWPSRGLLLEGYEVKSSRADWLRELKAPAKADPIFRYCDRWWLVANKDVVREGELPGPWGLLCPHGNGLRCVKEAPELQPESIDRSFLAGLLRRAVTAEGAAERKRAREAAKAAFDAENGYRIKHLESEVEHLRDVVKRYEDEWEAFRKDVGEDFPTWRLHGDLRKVAQVVVALSEAEDSTDGLRANLLRQADHIEASARRMREAAAAMT